MRYPKRDEFWTRSEAEWINGRRTPEFVATTRAVKGGQVFAAFRIAGTSILRFQTYDEVGNRVHLGPDGETTQTTALNRISANHFRGIVLRHYSIVSVGLFGGDDEEKTIRYANARDIMQEASESSPYVVLWEIDTLNGETIKRRRVWTVMNPSNA